ncbi:hypothetical protein TVNIR_1067 [Thioalkalivibrio nitratireducens DSM 14787]|uniref:Uncharacterized protein n=1 Tax=Thioalkalivibrio nitratireducens (strain DSM 14787 / UNIQEM 213 / ALEN2) TaxID=1255043 RepID=L0DWK2_THIND|nr:hypothetical protein [Thioalkalivibrio nitratireducens]AGA32751.1 hypothetical protein TVNIR_1067 [Thioalkalivibrio nitratireducens DSM 14787]
MAAEVPLKGDASDASGALPVVGTSAAGTVDDPPPADGLVLSIHGFP